MPDRRLCNARIHGWLADDLDRVADQTGSSKVQVNSAAVWEPIPDDGLPRHAERPPPRP